MLDITPEQLATAIPTALFGIFALWAASSTQHWFVRIATVGSALLVLLLVPAYEVVIQFGGLVLFVVLVLSIWKKRRQSAIGSVVIKRSGSTLPRVSMATLMLIVVVVAVVTAFAGRVPRWPLYVWGDVIGSALMGGVIVTGCVWIVFGRACWWVRLLAAPLLLVCFTFCLYILSRFPGAIKDWTNGKYQSFAYYAEAAWNSAAWGIGFWSRSVAIGMVIMIAWLFVVRRAGWLNPLGEDLTVRNKQDVVDRGTLVARTAAIALFVLIALLPLAILYRLACPPAIPTPKLDRPNGWDDLMAAGSIIGPEGAQSLIQWRQATGPLPPKLYMPEAVALMRRGFSRTIVNPYSYRKWTKADVQVFSQLYAAASVYAESASRSGDLDMQLDANWDYLRLANEEGRMLNESGTLNTDSYQYESMPIEYFWRMRTKLTQKQSCELLAKLTVYDQNRDTWEAKVARQRIVNANADWETRMNLILADWAGRDPFWDGYTAYNPVIKLRLLIADLAVRAYQLKYGKLPESLDAVVPEFVPAVPRDPFGSGPMRYRKLEKGYILYSVGPDGDDDSGRWLSDSNWDGDYATDLMFQQ